MLTQFVVWEVLSRGAMSYKPACISADGLTERGSSCETREKYGEAEIQGARAYSVRAQTEQKSEDPHSDTSCWGIWSHTGKP